MKYTVEANNSTDSYKVAVLFDKYTPVVESTLTKDLITLQNTASVNGLTVVSEFDGFDRILKVLGIPRIDAASIAECWLIYEVANAVEVPDNADSDSVIVRDLREDNAEAYLDPGYHAPFPLKPQGRPIPNQMYQRKPPPSHSTPVDPWFVMMIS